MCLVRVVEHSLQLVDILELLVQKHVVDVRVEPVTKAIIKNIFYTINDYCYATFFGARRSYDSITTVSMRKHLLTKVMGGKLGPRSDPLILLNFSFGYSMFGTFKGHFHEKSKKAKAIWE